jgi:hypothetical protein
MNYITVGLFMFLYLMFLLFVFILCYREKRQRNKMTVFAEDNTSADLTNHRTATAISNKMLSDNRHFSSRHQTTNSHMLINFN